MKTILALLLFSASTCLAQFNHRDLALVGQTSGLTGTEYTYITNQSVSATLRNNFAAPVGFRFTPSKTIYVTKVARWCFAPNTNSHTVGIYTSGGTALATATVQCSNTTTNQFIYATLSAPLQLTSGTVYNCWSTEASGGDGWNDQSDISIQTMSSDATINASSYQGGNDGNGVHSYVPVNFKYQLN